MVEKGLVNVKDDKPSSDKSCGVGGVLRNEKGGGV